VKFKGVDVLIYKGLQPQTPVVRRWEAWKWVIGFKLIWVFLLFIIGLSYHLVSSLSEKRFVKLKIVDVLIYKGLQPRIPVNRRWEAWKSVIGTF
jgi:hypothetical protein